VSIPISVAGGYIRVDKLGKRFMSENRASRHGFGVKEYVLFFDGVIGDFTRLPCYHIFDETARLRGPLSSSRKFGWFGWHSDYEWSRDNSKEIEKGWIVKGDTVAGLAAKLGMKPEDLEATIKGYNENCAKAWTRNSTGRSRAWLRSTSRLSMPSSFTHDGEYAGGRDETPSARSSTRTTSPFRGSTARAKWLVLGVDVQRRRKQRGVPLHGANRRPERRRHEAAGVELS